MEGQQVLVSELQQAPEVGRHIKAAEKAGNVHSVSSWRKVSILLSHFLSQLHASRWVGNWVDQDEPSIDVPLRIHEEPQLKLGGRAIP